MLNDILKPLYFVAALILGAAAIYLLATWAILGVGPPWMLLKGSLRLGAAYILLLRFLA